MARKYVNTAAGNDTTALLLKKVDEIISAVPSDIVAKFNTLQSSYASLLAKYNALQSAYAAIIVQLNAETALTQGPYVDGTESAVDGTSAATAPAASVPGKAADELYL